MKWVVINRVLHGMYEKKETISDDLLSIADGYEGRIPNRVGFNFPMSFVKAVHRGHNLLHYESKADYVIVYRKGDIQTKRHELQHAKYGMDKEYRVRVRHLWDSFDPTERDRIKALLVKMKYPDREEILLDEFQAYYFTEKPNFFGVALHTFAE
jgi:hypothetical protein